MVPTKLYTNLYYVLTNITPGYNVVLIARHSTKLQAVKEGMVTSAYSFNSFINQKRQAQGLRDGDISAIKSTDSSDQTNYTDTNIQYFSPPEIKLISCDLAEKGGPAYAMKELQRLGIDMKVDVLINCAGYAIQGRVINNPIDSLSDIIDLNLKSAVTLTRLLAPRIAKRGYGHSLTHSLTHLRTIMLLILTSSL